MRFFDTHAIVGILAGEARYKAHQHHAGYTHQMNILEALVKLTGRGMQDPWSLIRGLGLGLVEAGDDELSAAARLKFEPRVRSKRLSYIDALGIAVARRHNLPFLTGDPDFEGMDGVDFVEST